MLAKFKEILKNKQEVYLQIKVRPGASKTESKDVLSDDTIKIAIAAAPEKNKANIELIKFLAKEFLVSKDKIIILSGASDKTKLIKIKL